MSFPTHIVSSGGIVEDGQGNILLVKAHDDGWVYPGGITEAGENLIDVVIREIKEESGIITRLILNSNGSVNYIEYTTATSTELDVKLQRHV
ncbi:ADP-ribose pyrophosphatase YjhB (NUDIX family) [Paenibacillus sp. JGP012]|uniref:NUDIX domain-containing protein n=1 Tax=Paenibacillus sp. JGP012 TaxID=2735914 RepID=UPI00160CAA0B|nr:NUDIX hydrolase [Paenibacillus sp. JGP012]MBB6024448.1 ADP-ribose pyrophosphatase YjhB (NUDIX family) [Paenibacillus sp. JGP012]